MRAAEEHLAACLTGDDRAVESGATRKFKNSLFRSFTWYFQSVCCTANSRPPVDLLPPPHPPPELLSAGHVSHLCVAAASASIGAGVFADREGFRASAPLPLLLHPPFYHWSVQLLAVLNYLVFFSVKVIISKTISNLKQMHVCFSLLRSNKNKFLDCYFLFYYCIITMMDERFSNC